MSVGRRLHCYLEFRMLLSCKFDPEPAFDRGWSGRSAWMGFWAVGEMRDSDQPDAVESDADMPGGRDDRRKHPGRHRNGTSRTKRQGLLSWIAAAGNPAKKKRQPRRSGVDAFSTKQVSCRTLGQEFIGQKGTNGTLRRQYPRDFQSGRFARPGRSSSAQGYWRRRRNSIFVFQRNSRRYSSTAYT